jgi:hypothetical protein
MLQESYGLLVCLSPQGGSQCLDHFHLSALVAQPTAGAPGWPIKGDGLHPTGRLSLLIAKPQGP